MKAFTLYAVLGLVPFVACRAAVREEPAAPVVEQVVAPAPVVVLPPASPVVFEVLEEPVEKVVENKFQYHRFSRSGGPIEKVIRKPGLKNVN